MLSKISTFFKLLNDGYVKDDGYARYTLKTRIKRMFGADVSDDDFDWELYTEHYREQQKRKAPHYTASLAPGDFRFEDGRLILNAGIKPLHPNHHALYETLMQLAPTSIMEFGCGNGEHLHNLSVVLPEATLYGSDLSEGQLAFGRETYPNQKATVRQYDLSLPAGSLDYPKVDVTYTQAVIMHIQEGDKHLRALANVFHHAEKHVVLMENWTRHHFMNDIKALRDKGEIGWDELHFHYRESEQLKKPHIMIVSPTPLPQYPVLDDYALPEQQTSNEAAL